MNEIMLIVFNLFHSAILIVALKNISKIRFSIVQIIVMAIASVTVFSVVYFVSGIQILASLCFLITILIFTLLISRILYLSILFVTLAMITTMLAQNISVISIYLITEVRSDKEFLGGQFGIVQAIMVAILSLAISRYTGYLFHQKLKIFSIELKSKFAKYLIIGAAVTLAMYYCHMFLAEKPEYSDLWITVITVLLAAYFVSLVFTSYIAIVAIRNEMIATNRQELLENLQSYTRHIEDLYSNIRDFRHDYTNVMLSMYGYIEKGNMEELKEYFHRHIYPTKYEVEALSTNLDRLKNIHIPELKGLLALKLMYAQSIKVTVVAEISDEIEKISFDIVDMCKVVGILLDNAVDECRCLENSVLKFAIIKNQNSTELIVKNTVRSTSMAVSKMFERGYSTKGENRGVGLYNLLEILNKYNNVSITTELSGNELAQILTVSEAKEV